MRILGRNKVGGDTARVWGVRAWFAALVAMGVLTVGAGAQEAPPERRVSPVRSVPPSEAARPTAVQELPAQGEVPSPEFQARPGAALPPVPPGHA